MGCGESAGNFGENGSLSPGAMQKCRGRRCVYRAVVYHGLVHSASFFEAVIFQKNSIINKNCYICAVNQIYYQI